MIGKTVSHYRILEKLGEGGMGVVYKAQDLELDRIVALKFLPERLTSNDAERARFLQEAKAASALNHPNVCTIYGIDEFEGQKFIEMEYVDGVTLRKRIAESPLKTADAVAFAVQVGDALHEAHTQGIVHRDVKCENIMVNSKNQIKVMDFGLAKLKGSLKLTRTSSTVGTLAYMAPEQIQGGEVDARSDIFSFGIVLYEMLTGHTPFRGEHDAAMMYSILNEEPAPVARYQPDVSPEIDHIIRRALEKNPADRYQHVDDMVSELRRSQKQSSRVARPELSGTENAAPLSGQDSRPKRKFFVLGIAGAILFAAAVLIVLRITHSSNTAPGSARKMLVVLPFENLGTPEQEYFADGITEEITSKLSGLSGLGVIARSSAKQYKKTDKTVKQIGDELGVSYVLQGTIRWETSGSSSRVLVTPQLINVSDGTQIWSQPSEAVLASAFNLQTEIAGEVANALDLTLLQNEKNTLEAKLTENSEAFDSYLRGNEYLSRGISQRGYQIAEQMFEKAVELDPKFAQAYAKLGALHSHIYWEYYDHSYERVRKSKEAAEKALQLDPNLPNGHGAMGWYYYHCLRDYDRALKEFNLALNIQPENADLLLGLGSISRPQGKFEEALSYFQHVVRIDPRSPGLTLDLAATCVPMRRYAEAERYLDRSIGIAPDLVQPYSDKAQLYLLWNGSIPRAREALEKGAKRMMGGEDQLFSYSSILVDILDGKYKEASGQINSAGLKVFEYQFWFVPKELLLAQVAGYLGKSGEARSQYEKARIMLEREVRQHPEDGRMRSSLGIAYAGLGRKEEAIREGRRAVDLLPITKEAMIVPIRMQDLAQIYLMVGDRKAALDELEKLLSIPSYLSVPYVRIDPLWKPLAKDPRFQKLVGESS